MLQVEAQIGPAVQLEITLGTKTVFVYDMKTPLVFRPEHCSEVAVLM
jgi:hypothetical protein